MKIKINNIPGKWIELPISMKIGILVLGLLGCWLAVLFTGFLVRQFISSMGYLG